MPNIHSFILGSNLVWCQVKKEKEYWLKQLSSGDITTKPPVLSDCKTCIRYTFANNKLENSF